MATSKVKPRRKQSARAENTKTIVYAVLIAIAVRTFLFEPFNIPSGSMLPTLDIGDYLFVAKYGYGYSRYSFPFGWPPFSGRIFGRLPHRGDVAVFRYTRDTSEDYIKRIVGLPGDTVQMQGGVLYVNGKASPLQRAGQYATVDGDGVPILAQEFIETMPDGLRHPVLKERSDDWLNNTEVYKVPPGTIFAMGDNRDDSADSRFQNGLGYVPLENLVGRAEIIFFSIDARYPWWEFWEWPFEVRWGRIGMLIH